ncbi:3-hydroxyisobutyryl-CoA hydrolase-like protein 2 mitochondrial [Zea mays]|uniref:3-hydroxyisobutyryl-CoA hydrolase n=1 Tax=Zea mays TaxID=4577 RepID=A0A1D6K876_MAIZE|nr:3-hydroxyisobutyryl-CoA hydrolase-like protein 2 mitochondrial [Zea mays]
MPRLAAAAAVSRRAGEALRRGAFGGLRPLSSLQPLNAASSDEVLVEGKTSARAAVLNRPGYLNALTTTMGARLNKFYQSWEDNPDIGFVMNGISKQFSHEFCEGVRARLVDKDFTPKWDPPALEYVTNDMVDAYFAPLGDSEPELKLPIESREAFV